MQKSETPQKLLFSLDSVRCKVHQGNFIDLDQETFQILCRACEKGVENLQIEK
jgi:hypothetical protein